MLAVGVLCQGWRPRWGPGSAGVPHRDHAVPLRARALATLGGTTRIGLFVGPFLSTGVMQFMGTDGAYWLHLAAALLAAGG